MRWPLETTSVKISFKAPLDFFLVECTDIDECASVGTNECDPNAWCTNTEGSYSCRCIRGFEGDGKNCTGKKIIISVISQAKAYPEMFMVS